MVPQAEAWIASSLALLAMTAVARMERKRNPGNLETKTRFVSNHSYPMSALTDRRHCKANAAASGEVW